MNLISAEALRLALIHVCSVIIEHEPYLTEIDTLIGDGDHGVGMKRGFTSVLKMLQKEKEYKPYELFYSTGVELVRTMGGASGVLFGSLFIGGSKSIPQDSENLCLSDMALFFRSAFDAVKNRGKSDVGEKTMLDALAPAAREFDTSVGQGLDRRRCFTNAYLASSFGVEETIKMKSKKGRSKNFRDFTVGYPDPGAISISLIFKGFMEFFATNNI